MREEPPPQPYEVRDRRPMPPREWAVMRWFTEAAIKLHLSANAVSVLSVVFAVASSAALVATGHIGGSMHRLFWLAGAVGIELRAFCNLLDGMVAVRTKTASPVGELYNEVPDRISDIAMLAGLGYAAGMPMSLAEVHATPVLGWMAAALAVLVAYVRTQAAASGAGQDYGGVMAKPMRMQVVALGCLFMAAAPGAWRLAFWGPTINVSDKMTLQTWGVPQAVLGVIIVGCTITVVGRLARAARRLRGGVA